MNRRTAVDVATRIRSLQSAGRSFRNIARELHVSASTVHRWAHQDARPLYDNGAALLFFSDSVESSPPPDPAQD